MEMGDKGFEWRWVTRGSNGDGLQGVQMEMGDTGFEWRWVTRGMNAGRGKESFSYPECPHGSGAHKVSCSMGPGVLSEVKEARASS